MAGIQGIIMWANLAEVRERIASWCSIFELFKCRMKRSAALDRRSPYPTTPLTTRPAMSVSRTGWW